MRFGIGRGIRVGWSGFAVCAQLHCRRKHDREEAKDAERGGNAGAGVSSGASHGFTDVGRATGVDTGSTGV